MCEYNKEENKLLGLPADERCSLEKLGIQCRPETIEVCRRAEICLTCKGKQTCEGCSNK